ncbi:MAG: ABC transporter transmembrane domain-containing protein [Acutalibacteraceae bacterium]
MFWQGGYAKASSGLACNLREGMYDNIQTFSFSNIDKYSTAGLVTRMTTDVTNVQNAYQMILRIAVRAPLMLICSMVMCFFISARLSMIFLAAIVFWRRLSAHYDARHQDFQ